MTVWQLSEFSLQLTIPQPLGSTEWTRVGSHGLDWMIGLDRIGLDWIGLDSLGGNLIFLLLNLIPILNGLGWLTQ